MTLKESSSDDSNFQLYGKLSFTYPSLLHERDTRSKVVGIIGKGHTYSLVYDQGNLPFRDLAGKSSSDLAGEQGSSPASHHLREGHLPVFLIGN
ncbi:hypothetical protein K7X08_020108 [Anisodus acutangulus]|uniref:Uncharacterized protein n=1 Tax=Anisodus acutangulus TaxID=402998 RepID=A0A9Q1MAQ5_9SOLA|nr:hypothetical protein K7X08_020108 [Anisodus acutangulus]